jgi:hypothetical protein
MGMVFSFLQEDNKDVLALISSLDSLIKKLKQESKIPSEYLIAFYELYQERVVDFEKNYHMPGIEVPTHIQQEYEDLLYDLILTLKVFED